MRPSTLAVSMSTPLSISLRMSSLSPDRQAARNTQPAENFTRRVFGSFGWFDARFVSESSQRFSCSARFDTAELFRASNDIFTISLFAFSLSFPLHSFELLCDAHQFARRSERQQFSLRLFSLGTTHLPHCVLCIFNRPAAALSRFFISISQAIYHFHHRTRTYRKSLHSFFSPRLLFGYTTHAKFFSTRRCLLFAPLRLSSERISRSDFDRVDFPLYTFALIEFCACTSLRHSRTVYINYFQGFFRSPSSFGFCLLVPSGFIFNRSVLFLSVLGGHYLKIFHEIFAITTHNTSTLNWSHFDFD